MNKSKILIIAVPVLAVLALLFVYQYGYVKIRTEMSSIMERQEIKKDVLEKYMTRISKIPELQNELSQLILAREAYKKEFISGETVAIASASLQELAKNIITGSGGRILSERTGQPENIDKFRILNIGVNAVIPDVRVLSDILYSIETHTPSLFINEIDMSIRDYSKPRELLVKLNISGIKDE